MFGSNFYIQFKIISTGKCNVHLTGYLDPEFEEEPSDDEEEEEEDEEEAPTLVPAKGKRKLENSNDASSSKKKVLLYNKYLRKIKLIKMFTYFINFNLISINFSCAS